MEEKPITKKTDVTEAAKALEATGPGPQPKTATAEARPVEEEVKVSGSGGKIAKKHPPYSAESRGIAVTPADQDIPKGPSI
jgi:hypothetical protein